jgi:hypothetical protein
MSKAVAVTTASPQQGEPLLGCGPFAWSLHAVVTVLSGAREMLPKPELNCKVVNLMSGHGWVNNSFLLSRISRDLEATCKGRAQTGGLNIEVINAGKPGAVRNCPPSDR